MCRFARWVQPFALFLGLLGWAASGEAALSQGDEAAIPEDVEEAEVVRALDGETIVVRVNGSRKNATVRLLGVDAPALDARDDASACFAEEAHQAVEEEIDERTVFLERDDAGGDDDNDLAAYVWFEDDDDRVVFLNDRLVRDGFVLADSRVQDGEHVDRLRAAQDEAAAAVRGLWGECVVGSLGAYDSGGLGLALDDWEDEHGESDPDDGASRTYEWYGEPGPGGIWQYNIVLSSGNVWSIDYQWDEGVEVTLDEARATAATLMPVDGQYQFTGADEHNGFPMDVYFSPSLVDRFPPRDDFDPWSGDQPGLFLVIYFADELSGGLAWGFTMGTGSSG